MRKADEIRAAKIQGIESVQAGADWAAFEAMCGMVPELIRRGMEEKALLIVGELERYLRGEEWTWMKSNGVGS